MSPKVGSSHLAIWLMAKAGVARKKHNELKTLYASEAYRESLSRNPQVQIVEQRWSLEFDQGLLMSPI
ncbi:MAG: hypothetical protein K9K65_01720 [Desulfarculaceae bacterium]|nr:hypothetical protein [Desulfarculaceae bacterium]MCF8048238.1 hypothetical protein [Desulfarculaceae bacterium]MCF8064297.1 hypothetical protein [Desulfarculaceae bacterium]MCF8096536.1 hypothetical protein [Desulfarculaceae bacterium]MCF8121790.1 hypothetical protein [Desulfarculaceae bacterium]